MLHPALSVVLGLVVAAGSFGLAVSARSADDPAIKAANTQNTQNANTPAASGETQALAAATGIRASALMGLDVVNSKGEKLGDVEDLVLDMHTGQIRYAALSMGGFLGLGEKLFAVPWKAMRLSHAQDDATQKLLVLDVAKERLQSAPGFESSNWPDVGNREYWTQIDTFYQKNIQAVPPRATTAPRAP